MSHEYYDHPQREPGERDRTPRPGEVAHLPLEPAPAERGHPPATPPFQPGHPAVASGMPPKGTELSEEAKNQLRGGRKGPAESGKP
jgi:hypothetical protein